MRTWEFLNVLRTGVSTSETEAAIDEFELQHQGHINWVPFGGRENNRGTIEASGDPGRSLVERLTNGIDAVLEDEHAKHNGRPNCRSPKEAATAWLNVPSSGLSDMSTTERRTLAQKVAIRIQAGENRSSRIIEIRDYGIGLSPTQMPGTILSLNESNKMQKYYLAGAYGQGGSSTLAASKYVLIASRRGTDPVIGFTVACYQDLPPDEYKIGRYVYLTLDGSVLTAEQGIDDFASGTVVRHIGYDLTNYNSPLGPNSVYGLLNQILFDPVLPVWLDDYEVHNYRRVIKGSRNALNGAVDDGDAERRGPTLSHQMRMFYAELAESGRIGIEYWVLERPSAESRNKRPSAAFVNPAKPVILTLNGQNQAEMSTVIIKKDAELPFLTQRLICHVDCNNLSPAAKRALFVSNREDARRGMVYDLIYEEVVRALRSDDELIRLNNEAREQGLRQQDEAHIEQMRVEVARLLRLQGLNIGATISSQTRGQETQGEQPGGGRGRRRQLQPIELHEPPSFIRIVWDDGEPITFYPGQRRYIRIETDANSNYHNASNPEISRINIITMANGISYHGSTSLERGRMRSIFQTVPEAVTGSEGILRVELIRSGLPTLFDERPTLIVEPPPARSADRQITLPPFQHIRVEGPDDPKWAELEWPANIRVVASSALMESGVLVIYYSTVFPKYESQRALFERRDPALANSFISRYEIWLAVHSLLVHHDQHEVEGQSISHHSAEEEIEAEEKREMQERCRMATIATLVAAREVQASQGQNDPD
jgi:hypothetical protein